MQESHSIFCIETMLSFVSFKTLDSFKSTRVLSVGIGVGRSRRNKTRYVRMIDVQGLASHVASVVQRLPKEVVLDVYKK